MGCGTEEQGNCMASDISYRRKIKSFTQWINDEACFRISSSLDVIQKHKYRPNNKILLSLSWFIISIVHWNRKCIISEYMYNIILDMVYGCNSYKKLTI